MSRKELSNKDPPNKDHFSNDTKPFPFVILCAICLEAKGRSRSFYCPREKFYHVYKNHKDETDSKIQREITELEQLSIINQRGVLIK